MGFLGLLLLLTGFIMNIQVIRRFRSVNVEAADMMRSTPWLLSAGLIAVGVLLLALAR
jgi:hypothetical protein